MSLYDRLAAHTTVKRVQCSVCLYLSKLDEKDQCALMDALSNTTMAAVWIHEQMTAEGYIGGVRNVERHRKSKECVDREFSGPIKRSTTTRR